MTMDSNDIAKIAGELTDVQKELARLRRIETAAMTVANCVWVAGVSERYRNERIAKMEALRAALNSK